MDEEKKITPGYALDLIVEQHNTEKKRLWIALLVVFIALVGTNVGWIIYESQFEDVVMTQTVSQDSTGGGTNTINHVGDYIGGDYDGKADSNTND